MPLLLRLTLFTSLALLLVLALRAPLRRVLGAAAAYQAWLLAPVVTLAACLPTRSTPVLHVTSAVRTARALAMQWVPAPSLQVDILLVLWTTGAVAFAGWFVHAHWLFLRAVGSLRREGGLHFSAGGTGPASVGLFNPRIIVPHDFTLRYTATEQMMVLAHERTHIARRDVLANLLQAAFQCVFWYNPLVHLAARRFRHDQELSCDALVMAQHPRQRRAYAEALLKAHCPHSPPTAGINCHWQSRHPTKERFMQLQATPPGSSRRIAGRCIVVLLAASAVFGTLAARAGQAAIARNYAIQLALVTKGESSVPRVQARDGEKFAVATGPWLVEMTVRAAATPGDVWVASKIYKDANVVGNPTVLAHLNEPAGIRVEDGPDPISMMVLVKPQP